MGTLLTLVLFIVPNFFRLEMVIGPISVPKSLQDQGYKGTVVSSRIKDESERIQDVVKSRAIGDELRSKEDNDAVPDIEVPETGLSLKSVIQVIKLLVGREPNVLTGEIVCTNVSCTGNEHDTNISRYDVSYRISRRDRTIARGQFHLNTINEVITNLAEVVMSRTNPFVMGRYIDQVDHDPARAEALYRMGADDPNYRYRAWAYSGWGNALLEQGKVRAAVQMYRQAIKLEPMNSLLYCNLGSGLLEMNDIEGARDAYRKAEQLGPDSVFLHSGLAALYERQGRIDDAAKEYSKAVSMDPQNAGLYTLWGDNLTSICNFDAALDLYKKAASLSSSSETYSKIGALLVRMRRLDEAISAYKEAIKVNSNDANAYLGLGEVLLEERRHREAFATLSKAIKLDPSLRSVARGLALGHGITTIPRDSRPCAASTR